MIDSDPWRRLYACAFSYAFAYRFGQSATVDGWLDEDATAAAMNQFESAVRAIAGDRGEITFERWARATLETLEAELAERKGRGGHSRITGPTRRRYLAHIERLRALLLEVPQA